MTTDLARSRIEHWKSRLLDLSLRNKLLNYRPGRASSVPVVDEVPRVVVAKLVEEEKSLSFLPRPEKGPAAEGEHEFERVPDESLLPRHVDAMLQTTLTRKELDKVLYRLYLKSRTSREEQGAITLFLAVGTLEWFESRGSDDGHLAPILLVPAELSREGVGRPFRLTAAPEETEVNPSLLRKLLVTFGAIPEIPEGDGIDPDAVLDAFRRARPDPRWRVLTDMHLGLFSFAKYLMYRDLEDQGAVLTSPLVARLAGEDVGEEPATAIEPADLDRLRPPAEVHQILDADSSQQLAIETVRRGSDLVLQGPPGTGKSQTIANLIAETLADGRTVLFASEKMAALEVVKRRLDHAGLGDYVLELHSRHANKRDVVRELARCLERDRAKPPKTPEDLDRLVAIREELAAYVGALHGPFGEGGSTPHDALGVLASTAGLPDLVFPVEAPEDVPADRLHANRRRLRALARAREEVEPRDRHPFRHSRRTDVPEQVSIELRQALADLEARAGELGAVVAERCADLGLPKAPDLRRAETLAELHRHLSRSPRPEPAWIADPGWEGAGTRALGLLGKGAEYAKGREVLLASWTEDLFDLALEPLAERARRAGAGFGRLFRLSWWRDRGILNRVLRPGARRSAAERIEDLALAVRTAKLGEEIDADSPDAAGWYGDEWRGRETDWERLAAHADWIARLRTLLPVPAAPPEVVRAASAPAPLGARATEVMEAVRRADEATGKVRGLLEAETALPGGIDDLRALAREALDRFEDLYAWTTWRRSLAECRDAGLGPALEAGEEAGLAADDLEPCYVRAIARTIFDRARQARPVLRDFDAAAQDDRVERFRELDRRQLACAVARIRARLDGNLPASRSFSPQSDVGLLLREAAKKRRHLPIRKLLEKAGAAVRRIKPCFMMSPISIAQFLPPGSEPFDVIVFDEASQICPEDAIGAIARGSRLVVVGDSKQLPPTSFFAYDPDLPEPEDEEETPDLESILDLCATSGFPGLRLRWHYRSRDESLIAFSNRHFYDGDLVTFPGPGADPSLGVSFHHVEDGIYDRGKSRTNRVEARAVAEGIAAHLRSHPGWTIGAVTFSEAQRMAVLDALEALVHEDRELEALMHANEEEPLFVKNLENVQGDERDAMFFSVGYGRDAGGKLSMNFGPLNGDGGHRRLNVAVTRARRCVRVYSSILPEDIDPARAKGRGARLLRSYIEYARRGARGGLGEEAGGAAPESAAVEEAVADALASRGLTVDHHVGSSAYRLDLAVADPEAERGFVLGIECDGDTYRDAATARDRERTRPEVLTRLGWRVARVWSPEWVRSPGKEVERLTRELAEGPPEPPPTAVPAAAAPAAAEDAPTQEAGGLPSAPPYEETPREKRNPRWPLKEEGREVARIVAAIVSYEGPIHEALLSRRVADSYETKHTKKVRDATAHGIRLAVADGRIEERGDFLWPPGAGEAKARGAAEGERPRKMQHVPPEEIADAVRTVLGVDLRLPREALEKAVAHLLGHRRPSAKTLARIGEVISDQAALGVVEEADGAVSRPDGVDEDDWR